MYYEIKLSLLSRVSAIHFHLLILFLHFLDAALREDCDVQPVELTSEQATYERAEKVGSPVRVGVVVQLKVDLRIHTLAVVSVHDAHDRRGIDAAAEEMAHANKGVKGSSDDRTVNEADVGWRVAWGLHEEDDEDEEEGSDDGHESGLKCASRRGATHCFSVDWAHSWHPFLRDRS